MDDSNISPDERAEADHPFVGAGTPATAPLEATFVPWLQRQPLIAALIVIEAPILGALVTSFASGAPVALQVLLTILAPLVLAVVAAARAVVTPIARPRLDAETPLVPSARGVRSPV